MSTWRSSSRSTAARRSAAPSGSARVAARVVAHAPRPGTRSASSCRRWATRPTSCSSSQGRSLTRRTTASWTCCSRRASGSRWRCSRWRSSTSDGAGDLVHGLAGGHRHGHERTGRRRSSRCGRGGCARSSERGTIAIVAGFQGVSTEDEVTTLGRGGSDATAVALAAGLGADVCEIYTDVDGVYTADPRIVPGARKLPELSYEEMLELAASGREGADDPLGRVRAQPRRRHPRALVVLGRRGDVGAKGGGADGAGDHLRGRPRYGGGESDDRRGTGPPGDRRARVSPARRRRREHRHDRPERVRGRANGHLLHAAAGRPAEGRPDPRRSRHRRGRDRRHDRRGTSPRSRSSAPA